MIIKPEHLQTIFDEVKKVRAAITKICKQSDVVPVSLDDISEAIEGLYGKKIISRLVPLNSTLVRGMIEIYEDRAIITIDAALNTPFTRYVFVKEACHILLLNAENQTTDPGEIIEYYVHHSLDEQELPSQILCEEITKHGAVELLFPPSLRQDAKKRIASGQDTLFTIAESMHIPENLVEYALRDYYIDLSRRMSGMADEPERFAPAPKKAKPK
jgi:hypothetical protein